MKFIVKLVIYVLITYWLLNLIDTSCRIQDLNCIVLLEHADFDTSEGILARLTVEFMVHIETQTSPSEWYCGILDLLRVVWFIPSHTSYAKVTA